MVGGTNFRKACEKAGGSLRTDKFSSCFFGDIEIVKTDYSVTVWNGKRGAISLTHAYDGMTTSDYYDGKKWRKFGREDIIGTSEEKRIIRKDKWFWKNQEVTKEEYERRIKEHKG